MFYVIYSPLAKQYLSDAGGLDSFAKAEQFGSREDAECALNEHAPNMRAYPNLVRVVGPCIEGEQP
jgi:hypothetical protein